MQGAGFSEHWRQVRQTAPGGQGMSHLRLSTAALIWGLLHLWLAGCAASDTTAQKGPPFPRIANLYAVWLEPDEISVSREMASLAQVARYDLLVYSANTHRHP